MKNIISNLIRLYQWLPLIWNDRDWDYAFLLKIMQFKLTRMRHVIETGHGVSSLDCASQILEIELLLRNILDGDPTDPWTLHYDRYHVGGVFECTNKTGCKFAVDASQRLTEQNWNALWRHMDKHCRNFWD